MARQRLWPTLAFLLLLAVAAAVAQSVSLKSSEVTRFTGTWVFTMTEPQELKGSQQTVRIWDVNGIVAASLQVGSFPAHSVTGIAKDGDMLVLTISHEAQPALLENGAPIWAVISLTLDGDAMRIAQMLERSQTIKRGTGRRQAD